MVKPADPRLRNGAPAPDDASSGRGRHAVGDAQEQRAAFGVDAARGPKLPDCAEPPRLDGHDHHRMVRQTPASPSLQVGVSLRSSLVVGRSLAVTALTMRSKLADFCRRSSGIWTSCVSIWKAS